MDHRETVVAALISPVSSLRSNIGNS